MLLLCLPCHTNMANLSQPKNNHILQSIYTLYHGRSQNSALFLCQILIFCIFSHFLLILFLHLLLHWFHFGRFHYLFVLHHSFSVWGREKNFIPFRVPIRHAEAYSHLFFVGQFIMAWTTLWIRFIIVINTVDGRLCTQTDTQTHCEWGQEQTHWVREESKS